MKDKFQCLSIFGEKHGNSVPWEELPPPSETEQVPICPYDLLLTHHNEGIEVLSSPATAENPSALEYYEQTSSLLALANRGANISKIRKKVPTN